MKIGTLRFDMYANLFHDESIESFISAMDPVFSSISSDFDSEYTRFGFFAMTMIINLNLDIFWKNDSLYNTLKKQLNKNFSFWRVKMTLTINETGG
ncbi:hypothetical protein LCGC14_2536050 [marine sediment metagenome]|uniref:Uncharacterized protein n=1 Tax=marine sediment metagenome TaxID=412755 RepID=A0A0F9BF25_9ZZZZ